MEAHSFKSLFNKMTSGNYQIGVMSWWPKINDPFYTFQAFKNREYKVNFSGWENEKYKELLEKAERELDASKRRFLLAKAETLLMNEYPVIPIFHENELFIRQTYLGGIFPSSIGNIDFKYAYINKKIKIVENI
jgi:oligopeptide transport system substrate-binding protein